MKLVTVPAVTQVGHGLTFSLAFEIIFLFMGGAKKKKKKRKIKESEKGEAEKMIKTMT